MDASLGTAYPWLAYGLLALTIAAVIVLVYVLVRRNTRRKMDLLRDGVPAVAEVLSIHQRGSEVNDVPVMRLRVRIAQAGVPAREVEFDQLIDLGNMPRAGEQVAVMLDPAKAGNVLYLGLASAMAAKVAAQDHAADALSGGQVKEVLAMAPGVRESGKLGVGTVLTSARRGTQVHMTVEVDSVIEPRYIATVDQMWDGPEFAPGERAYLLIDPTDRESVALVPLSFSKGQKIDPQANRLDAMVLGPQLLHEGCKGNALVLAAHEINLPTMAWVVMPGATRWHLRVRITPQDGSASYEAEQDISFTTKEKAASICVVGRTVPVRYDANDPQTWSTDAIALENPDPYVAVMEAAKKAEAAGLLKG